jgi:hypothetical protein
MKVRAEVRQVVASANINSDPEDKDPDEWDDDDAGWDLVDKPQTDQEYAANMPDMVGSDSDTSRQATMAPNRRHDFDAEEAAADAEAELHGDETETWIDEFEDKDMPLADELGIEDLTDILFADRGRILSAAGRDAPVAEFEENGVLLRPPQKPWLDSGPEEEVIYHADEHGILLNELGERRKIVGAKYKGMPVYVIAEQKPGTVKHYAAWFDEAMRPHKFFVQGDALTSDMVFRIRNRTHDGEISIFPEIQSE